MPRKSTKQSSSTVTSLFWGDARREVEEARGVAPSVAAVAVDEVAADEDCVAVLHEGKRLIRIAVVEIRGKCEC